MKTRTLFQVLCIGTLAAWLGGAGCTVNAPVQGNAVNFNNAQVNFDVVNADVNNIMAGQAVSLTVNVQNVFLVEPSAQPPPDHVMDAGHIEIHLDDENTPPLAVTAQVKVDVKIPADVKPGGHKLICRVHKHDGTPTTAVFEVNITVMVVVNPMPDMTTPMPDASPRG